MSIGDIHGRNTWKNPVFGSVMDYEQWRREVDNGIVEFMADQYPKLQSLDKIVFIGDYVDSFDISNVDMLRNLEEIIHFKKTYLIQSILCISYFKLSYVCKKSG